MAETNLADLTIGPSGQARVRRVAGGVDDSLNGATGASRKHGRMAWIHARHEEVATFAAAEARLGGELQSRHGAGGRERPRRGDRGPRAPDHRRAMRSGRKREPAPFHGASPGAAAACGKESP